MGTTNKHLQKSLVRKNAWLLPVWAVICCLVMAGNSSIVAAQTVRDDDYEALIEETTFYDLVPLGSCGAAAEGEGVTLQGKDNIQQGFNFFIAKGLTPVQSAGIIGNFRHESGMNPSSKQLGGGPGRGIAQWEVGGRWDALQSWAKKRNQDPLKLLTQLEFAWQEMPKQFSYGYLPQLQAVLPKAKANTSALDAVKMSTTVRVATIAFQYTFERAGAESLNSRVTKAQETLDAFGGQVPDNVAPSGACGGDGITIDGYSFPVAPQTQRSYTSLPCDSKNPNSRSANYTPDGGSSVRILTCHHDNTPAFDLMYDGVAGKPIYAITEGIVVGVSRSYVMDSGRKGKPCGEIQFQSTNGRESTYYWYGHILPGPDVVVGKKFGGDGQPKQLGTVATQDFGPKCWGGGPHLHIDRGCIVGTKPRQGGSDGCRDPQFLQDLQKIWEGLPASS